MSQVKALLEKIEESQRMCAELILMQNKFADDFDKRTKKMKDLIAGMSEAIPDTYEQGSH